MDIDSKQQLEAVQKRITEIFMNAKFCKKIDISIHVDLDSYPDISYTVAEYCLPDEIMEYCGITEEDARFIKKEKKDDRL